MQPHRPAGVTTIAILNFVFGGLHLVGLLCGGGMVALFVTLAAGLPGRAPTVTSAVVALLSPIAILIVMFHPVVIAAFAGRGPRDEPAAAGDHPRDAPDRDRWGEER